MAATAVLRRKSGKAHPSPLVEGTDDAILDSIITSAVTTGDLYNDANTTTVNVGGSALTTLNLGTGSAVTAVSLGTGTGAGDTIAIGGAGSITTVAGDLVVNGTTTSVDSETVNIADNHLYLNKDYTTAVAQSGGIVVNYLPTATVDNSGTGGFATTTTVITDASATFAVGDFIQVSGAANPANDGLYEVLTHIGTTATIDASPTHSFSQTAFTVDTGDTTAVITKVTVSALQAGTDGVWETGAGATVSSLTFSDLATAAGVTLDTAYGAGNTITMTDADGDFDVSVTSGTPAISLDAAGASNFTVASAGLTLSTTTSGTLLLSGAALVDIDAAANMDIDVTGSFDMLSTGTFSIDGTGASNVATASGDLTVSSGTGSVVVDGGEAAADAVQLIASNAAGGITVAAGTGGYSIGSADTAIQTINAWTGGTGAKTATLGSTASSSSMTLQAGTGATTFTAGGIFDVNATGAVTVDTSAGVAIEAATASTFNVTTGALTLSTTTSGDLTISTTTAGDILLSGAAEIDLTAAGLIDVNAGANLDIDVTGTYDMLASSTFSIDGTGASNVTTASGDLTVSSGTGSVIVTAGEAVADAVQITASNAGGGVDINAGATTGTVTIDGGGACTITTAGINLAAGSSEIDLTTTGAVDINSAAGTWDSSAGIAFEAATASTFNVTTGALTLSTTTSGNLTLSTMTAGDILLSGAAEIDLTATTVVDINAADVTMDTSAAISLDAATASNFTVSGATADLTLGARSTTITLNESGETSLDAAFDATSIIGALNELKTAGVAEASQVVITDIATTGLTVGAPVYVSGTDTASHTDASALSTSLFIGIVKTVGAAGTGEIVTDGVTAMSFAAGLTVSAGDQIYLSETVARVTNVAPAASGSVAASIGICHDTTGLTATTVDGETADCTISRLGFTEN